MLIADLEHILDTLAPFSLAEEWDNSGLQVGDREAAVQRILVALDLTMPVMDEAVSLECDTILTHHPVFFTPVRRLVESDPRERMLRAAVARGINVIACHTNLDSAGGGIADVVSDTLRLRDTRPLQTASAGWYKLVGFVPATALDKVASAVFGANAGNIGDYRECAFAATGQGWFTPTPAAEPTVGRIGLPERAPEVRWETVVPRGRLSAAVRAYVDAHPYEEPAFDIYPVEDVLPRVGLGRVGTLTREETMQDLAGRLAQVLGLPSLSWTGEGSRRVTRVAVVPGSGSSLLEQAAGVADVLVTGDVSYHDADRALAAGIALIDAPHEDLEWFALQRWAPMLADRLAEEQVNVTVSTAWRSPWNRSTVAASPADTPATGDAVAANDGPPLSEDPHGAPGGAAQVSGAITRASLHVDGGSRGNPGPSAIGAVLEDSDGNVIEEFGQTIGVTTNNVAEYRSLLAGLDLARAHGVEELAVFADSELMVKQIKGQYRVKNEGLKPLHEEVLAKMGAFRRVTVEHVVRQRNSHADRLVNEALDGARS